MVKPDKNYLRCKQIINFFRKNVASDKKYILRKMSLNFQNSKCDISCKIEINIFFYYKLELFGVKRPMRSYVAE